MRSRSLGLRFLVTLAALAVLVLLAGTLTGADITLAIGEDEWATGNIDGCRITYESIVVTDLRNVTERAERQVASVDARREEFADLDERIKVVTEQLDSVEGAARSRIPSSRRRCPTVYAITA